MKVKVLTSKTITLEDQSEIAHLWNIIDDWIDFNSGSMVSDSSRFDFAKKLLEFLAED